MFSRRQTPITRLLANLEGRDRGQHDTLAAGAQLSKRLKLSSGTEDGQGFTTS